jgi:hypothetical protein
VEPEAAYSVSVSSSSAFLLLLQLLLHYDFCSFFFYCFFSNEGPSEAPAKNMMAQRGAEYKQ